MDCTTKRGQYFIAEQNRVTDWLEKRGYYTVGYLQDDSNADVLICIRVNERMVLSGIAEIKCRESANGQDLTLEYLKGGGYLITNDKLLHGQQLSKLHKVPFYVIVSLMKDNKILQWEITDSEGNFQIKNMELRSSKTQATCNGGEATRLNAYLPVETSFLTIYEKQDGW